MDTSVLLPGSYAFISQFLSIVLRCGGQLLIVTFSFSSAKCIRWPGFGPDQSFLSLCHRRHVAGLCMLYKINSNSNHCLFSRLPSAPAKVRHTRAAAAAHSLEFEVSSSRTSQFARYFLPGQVRMWNGLLYTVIDTGTLDGFKGWVNRWLLLWVLVSSVFRSAGACGVTKAICKQFCFFNLCLCCWFNNNNNIIYDVIIYLLLLW